MSPSSRHSASQPAMGSMCSASCSRKKSPRRRTAPLRLSSELSARGLCSRDSSFA